MTKATNITWHDAAITKEDRRAQNGHGSVVLWFTGLSGSGKSTIANAVSHELFRQGINEYVLDGDNVRHGLNKDLGFSEADRNENIRRIGEVAKLFVDSGKIVTTAFISPFRSDRETVRALFEEGEFIEVFIDCPLEECERRDPKQLYAKARRGEIKDFTGIDSPYEAPEQPEITVRSDQYTVEEAVGQILTHLREKNIL
ncbi:adenylyl-sulfate kinase [Bacillus sp. CMF12]|uniref:adenylyl-sulfate kinase n=1 Tax=Bacillaceae TaxID=186817 RepID=UPI001FB20502|nr:MULTISPECIES: adenylyl-sulfate kinase [Bacillaceae]MDF2035823.1 adenylyl-sulfate kinase [Cytobacillus oceanisediminis]UOE53129.1 adenylyl-sulfate kinase [Cytobacillus oceanisediminis]USK52337.1 adenylyl-sulfate kinase [Bacillus sp. CMF12]